MTSFSLLRLLTDGVAVKRLSAVEARPDRSHQHEFNGVAPLKRLLGEGRKVFPALLLYVGAERADVRTAKSAVTWYDARADHPHRSEHRLYFPPTSVTNGAHEGDLLVIARLLADRLVVVIAQQGSRAEEDLLGILRLATAGSRFELPELS